MTNAFMLFIASILFVPALSGCVASASSSSERDFVASARLPQGDARLRPGDRVQVTVFGEDGLTGGYDVAPSGVLQLPLAGSVPAAGRSARELEAAIAAALRKSYLRDPKVTVAIVSQRPFYVLGEVEKPGEYPYREGLNLWRALAVAGGQTYRASTASVLIQHAGETALAEVDTGRVITIEPGDLIRVPERWF